MEQQFRELHQKMTSYNEAISLLYWDMRTGAPKKGQDLRAETIGTLSSELFALSTSEDYGKLIAGLKQQDGLSTAMQRSVEEADREYQLNAKIPPEEYREFVVLTSKAESVWEQAKEQADFALFQPYLEQLVETTRRFVGYWGMKNGSVYNTLLDQYEPGVTTEQLDKVFGQLRDRIVPLVKQIQEAENQPDTEFLYGHFPKQAQQDFSLDVLKQLGYDFDAGRLDETVHPFMIAVNRGDVRVTTKYDEQDFRTAVFGTIHEAGHALYEQNISSELSGLPVDGGSSMGIHESQSLFFENFVGRNESFWRHNYEKFLTYAPDSFKKIPMDEFLAAINESKPSLIRIEADELTYALHIMIRYELEKGLFDGEYEVKDLPALWNDKYEEYLGIRPEHDGEGVLQDVHWAGGSFGYFPSYALGLLYAAQFKNAMQQDIPNFDELLANGEIGPVTQWLTDKVHQHGAVKKPLELLEEATGEGLNGNHLAEYLEAKYTKIYQLK